MHNCAEIEGYEDKFKKTLHIKKTKTIHDCFFSSGAHLTVIMFDETCADFLAGRRRWTGSVFAI
jgi:hypothetical protein